MRVLTLIALLAAVAAGVSSPAVAQSKFFSFERNTDRPGSDYSNTASDGASDCSFKCQVENQCVAWTYVKRGVQGATGRCFLKRPAPAARADNCCTSGVRLGRPSTF